MRDLYGRLLSPDGGEGTGTATADTETDKTEDKSTDTETEEKGTEEASFEITEPGGKKRKVTETELRNLAERGLGAGKKFNEAKTAIEAVNTIKGLRSKVMGGTATAEEMDKYLGAIGMDFDERQELIGKVREARAAQGEEDEEEEEEEEAEAKPRKKKGKKVDTETDTEADKKVAKALDLSSAACLRDAQKTLDLALATHDFSGTIKKVGDETKRKRWQGELKTSAEGFLGQMIRAQGYDPETIDGLAEKAVEQAVGRAQELFLGGDPPNAGPSGPGANANTTVPKPGKRPDMKDPEAYGKYLAEKIAYKLQQGPEGEEGG